MLHLSNTKSLSITGSLNNKKATHNKMSSFKIHFMIAPHLYSEELLFDNRLRRWAVLGKHFKTLRISKCLQMTVIRMLSVYPGQATTVDALLRRNPLLSHIIWACPINEITNVSRNLYLLLSWTHSTTSINICQPVFLETGCKVHIGGKYYCVSRLQG